MQFCAALMAFVVAFSVSAYAAEKETAFDRVTKTNTLRCSYVVLPPELMRDPNSGQISGISYDIVMEAAKRLGLKVEWTEEVTFATMTEGFKTGRYDAFCFTAYRWLPSTRAMEYTNPIFYSTTNAYTRANDKRFDNNPASINDPKITVATIDGEASTSIKDEEFPKAKTFSMPQNSDMAQLFEAVTSGKADVTVANPLMVMPYLIGKPNALHRVEVRRPIRIYGHALAFGKGEHNLLTMFNTALDELITSGFVDQVLDKYEKVPNSFVRIPPPATK